MMFITVNGKEYGVEIKSNKYGSILNIYDNGMVWYTDIIDLININNLADYIAQEIMDMQDLDIELEKSQ